MRKHGSSEAFGSIWDYALAFEFLLERLEVWKALANEFPSPDHFSINTNHCWSKLHDYYLKLDETPVYYAAVALHPAYRWSFFDDKWDSPHMQPWITKAQKMVEDVWEAEYKEDERYNVILEEKPSIKRRRIMQSKFGRFRIQTRCTPSPMSGSPSPSPIPSPSSHRSRSIEQSDTRPLDEYQRWINSPEKNDDLVVDPFNYWRERRATYPRLAQMALDFLSIPAMSAEVERLFSSAGRMITAERASLDAKIIGICQTLRSWHLQGLITLPSDDPLLFEAPPSVPIREDGEGYIRESEAGLPSAIVVRDPDGRVSGRARAISWSSSPSR